MRQVINTSSFMLLKRIREIDMCRCRSESRVSLKDRISKEVKVMTVTQQLICVHVMSRSQLKHNKQNLSDPQTQRLNYFLEALDIQASSSRTHWHVGGPTGVPSFRAHTSLARG